MNKAVKIILRLLLGIIAVIGVLTVLNIVSFEQFKTHTTTTVETGNKIGGIESGEATDTIKYTYESWKELISDDCKSFFDGCNTCNRTENGGIVCTRMACEIYEKPICLDNETIDNKLNDENKKDMENTQSIDNIEDSEGQVKNAKNVPTCDASDPLSQCKLVNEDIDATMGNEELPVEPKTFLSREESLERVKTEKLIKITEYSSLEVVFETKVETDQGEEYYKYMTQEPQISAYKDLVKSCNPACENVLIETI